MTDEFDTTRGMIDIETLSTAPDAAVVAIGAVSFSLSDGIESERAISINLESNQVNGRTIDANTVEWVLNQSDDVQNQYCGGQELFRGLTELSEWWQQESPEEVWAKSPAFDVVILDSAYQAVDLRAPWDYWQSRDVRTVASLPEWQEIPSDGEDHLAIADARGQARNVIATLRDVHTNPGSITPRVDGIKSPMQEDEE